MTKRHGQSYGQAIIFLGAPGSGKGTQAARLSAELGIPAVSTGEMLRRECQSGSELGKTVQSILASGQLVGDELINRAVASRLSEPDCASGFILDGYPRTVAQARFLDSLLRGSRAPRPIVFHFEIAHDEVVARITHRLTCKECGRIYSAPDGTADMRCDGDGSLLVRRADDNEVSVRERLRLYGANAAPLVRYYRSGKYHKVAAHRTAEEITDELLGVLVPAPVAMPVHRPVPAAAAAYA